MATLCRKLNNPRVYDVINVIGSGWTHWNNTQGLVSKNLEPAKETCIHFYAAIYTEARQAVRKHLEEQ